MMDAETTLVNGETFELDTNFSSPHRPQRSSSSSSDDEERLADFNSQHIPFRTLDGDRRFWNGKVVETQQTVLEILEQVSQVRQCFFQLRRQWLTIEENTLTILMC